MKIILGSQSSNRKAVLKNAGYSFEVMPSNIDEKAIRIEDPKRLVSAISSAKADFLEDKIPENSMLITADTIVYCNNEILEKPINYEEAWNFFQMYADNPVEIVTGVVVLNSETKERKQAVDNAKIWFSPFLLEEFESLEKCTDMLNLAGGFTILDEPIKKHIVKTEGDESTILGLPIKPIREFIKCLT
jgi:septum formation protein